jgi:acetyltransferase-like isoleucine patch superfamily enzyme
MNIHEEACIEVGDDCLFAADVSLSCSSVHKIYDLKSMDRINPPGDVVVGDRVWICGESNLWGGTKIGQDSVIAFRSFVKECFPPNTLIGGMPARVLREGITWKP